MLPEPLVLHQFQTYLARAIVFTAFPNTSVLEPLCLQHYQTILQEVFVSRESFRFYNVASKIGLATVPNTVSLESFGLHH